MRICVAGDTQDLTLVYLAWLARHRGFDVIELSEDALGIEWAFQFDDRAPAEGTLEVGDMHYPFTDVNGAYVRLNPEPALPAGLELSLPQRHAFLVERRSGLQHLLEHLPCTVANRPSAGRSNGSKPHQMHLLQRAGFDVPQWIVSNSEAVVQDFAATCHEGAIYKSCSGLRSRVRKLDDTIAERLRQGTSPIIVQEYIPGRDVRIHTVRQVFFPTEVIGEGIDYRFENELGHIYRAASVPEAIGQLCCRVAEAEGLTIAGFDFRVTDDGHWYCLEMNPVPTFLPYEIATGQPIGNAVLDVFTSPVKNPGL
jgi:glutathione synthase/RimK-type ligase-like ATP-grasp enzyme